MKVEEDRLEKVLTRLAASAGLLAATPESPREVPARV
jgi:hypothetical protein